MTDSAQGGKVDIWFTPAELFCAAGTGTCSFGPNVILAHGPATWWVQTWNPFGYGPWSAGMGFTVSLPSIIPTLVSPNGNTGTTTPTYTWTADSGGDLLPALRGRQLPVREG